jgi:hypothetical protein
VSQTANPRAHVSYTRVVSRRSRLLSTSASSGRDIDTCACLDDVTLTISSRVLVMQNRIKSQPTHPIFRGLSPAKMSQLTFTLNDGNRIPFLAFGTGTSFGRQDVTEPASLAIEKGFTHLDCAQVRTYNHSRSVPVFMVEMSKSSLITTKTLSVPRSRHPESPENRSL